MTEQTKRKFYITGGRLADGTWRGDDQRPIVGYGKDSLDALANSGLTVWEEDAYLEAVARHPSPPEPIHDPTLAKAIEAVQGLRQVFVDGWQATHPGQEHTDLWQCHLTTFSAAIDALEALRDTRTPEKSHD